MSESVKCPVCGHSFTGKPIKNWKFRFSFNFRIRVGDYE